MRYRKKIRTIKYFIYLIWLKSGVSNLLTSRATFEVKICLGPWIKYYNSIDICYSKNIVNNVEIRTLLFFTLSFPKNGERIVIGLAESATSKGPQIMTMEPMNSIKVTNCSIQLGWILARDGFAKNYMGSRRETKKCDFLI